ncbi:tyrosine-type recombinase/integrase [Salinivibrio sp. IB872]|uniref:tyrosine-type recombinase/integrase n=1 Tax=Salinivibrio sp. IB872 TaxID=1766123 RepID=UPI00098552D4|nr:tyrosine-type recombinase/integrase [Salinivibrio sp. IB872]OOF24422.1 integrase [Salinivibrio sp. IB872]
MKKINPIDNNHLSASIQKFNQGVLSIEDWDSVTESRYSRNSLLSYRNDWQVFVSFCQSQHVTALPCAVTTLRRFAELTSQQRKVSAIRRIIVTVGLVHRLHRQRDPSKHREVKYAMARLLAAKLPEAKEAAPFRKRHLSALREHFQSSKRLRDIRDLLIWSLCYEGLLKRSELAALAAEDVLYDGEKAYVMIGEQRVVLSEQTAVTLAIWLKYSGIHQGPLLRRINKHGHLGDTPLDPSSIYRVFRRASDVLGESVVFSGQSPRVGASKALAKQGLSIKQIQHLGRWKSPAMPAQYVGNREASEQAKARYRHKKSTE